MFNLKSKRAFVPYNTSGRKIRHEVLTVNILYLKPSPRIAYLQRGTTLLEKNAITRQVDKSLSIRRLWVFGSKEAFSTLSSQPHPYRNGVCIPIRMGSSFNKDGACLQLQGRRHACRKVRAPALSESLSGLQPSFSPSLSQIPVVLTFYFL